MTLEHKHFITPEEYLEIDHASQDVKYEYIDGRMYAMSGGTINHGQIAYNMANLVHTHLKSKTCRFFTALYDLTSVPVEEEDTDNTIGDNQYDS